MYRVHFKSIIDQFYVIDLCKFYSDINKFSCSHQWKTTNRVFSFSADTNSNNNRFQMFQYPSLIFHVSSFNMTSQITLQCCSVITFFAFISHTFMLRFFMCFKVSFVSKISITLLAFVSNTLVNMLKSYLRCLFSETRNYNDNYKSI